MAKRNQARAQNPDQIDEVGELKRRLAETEETLMAIQHYLVDAFVVNRSGNAKVVTLAETDIPYRLMVEAMNEGAVTIIPGGKILYANPRFCTMVHKKAEQLIGTPFRELLLPAVQEAFDSFLREAVEAGQSGVRGEFCLQASQERCLPVQLSIYELSSDGAHGLSIIAADLSERRHAEEALRQSEELFRFVVTNSPDVVFTQDLDLKYTWIINPVAPFTAQQVIGKTDWDLLPPDEAERVTELKKEILETGASMRRELLLSAGGNPYWYDVIYQPTYNGNGQVNGLIGYSRNITESVQAKEKVRSLASALTKAEQEERHRISQILHDDLQQRLFAIKANLSMLTYGKEDDVPPEMLAALERLQNDLAATVSITRNLSVGLSPIILHGEGLADAILWLSNQMKEQFDLQIEIEAKESFNYLEEHVRVLLFRAVRELLFNIVKHAGTREAWVRLEQGDSCVRIIVSDMGTGFEVESVLNDRKLAHGLMIISDRLTLMGGSMEVTSKVGQGTRVEIEMPFEPVSV
jgi:two-component system, chemotaxis family, CheB/CheR fusion protein